MLGESTNGHSGKKIRPSLQEDGLQATYKLIVGYGVFDADNTITFLSETLDKHGIQPNQLVLHSDNGSAVRAVDTLAMLKAYHTAIHV